MIPFNEPFFHPTCIDNIRDTVRHQSGDGKYSHLVYDFLKDRYRFANTLLTSSCTHSLEMMAMILKIGPGDEILLPSYTFVSTANAFVKFGARVVLVDSSPDHPNMDIEALSFLITEKTRAICVVHYAGVSCDMDTLMEICATHKIHLLEDAAQAFHSYYNGRPLGSFGCMAAFSFHETKNFNCGEGGLLVVNDPRLWLDAQIIREKGTNRTAFRQGRVSKYEWVGYGSSYLMSDINAAYLYAQFQMIDEIVQHRQMLWRTYEKYLCQQNPEGNYHIYYILCHSPARLQKLLSTHQIMTTTHYIPLHESSFYQTTFGELNLPCAQFFHRHLLRLPLYHNLRQEQVEMICGYILGSNELLSRNANGRITHER